MPGEQAQVDWGLFGFIDHHGRRRKLYGFVMTLVWSRASYLEFTISADAALSDSRSKIVVRDNGCGCELLPSTSDYAVTGKFGLLGIEERVQLLHGHFQVQSSKGEGTTVSVDVPVQGA